MAQTNGNRNPQKSTSSINKSNINEALSGQNKDLKKNKGVKVSHQAEPAIEDGESDNIGNKKLSTEKSDHANSQLSSGNRH